MPYKIVILILYSSSWKEIADIVLPVVRKYCAKHGYEFNFHQFPSFTTDFGFQKLSYTKEIFDDGIFNVVVSMDLDTLITNTNIRFEELIDEEHDFFITKDINNLNGGVFITKKSMWSEYFLDWCMKAKGVKNIHCEQDAIIYYKTLFPNETKIKVLPQQTMNAYLYQEYVEFGIQTKENGQWVEGESFILHLPGIGMERRLSILKNTPIIE